jgi:uncharacterized protein YbjT (DUF2867 family)
MAQRTAVVLGATGLVGGFLTGKLLDNPDYHKVVVLARTPGGREHPKLEEHIIDFNRLEDYGGLFAADDVFCCIGTTMKKAGSKEAFRKVDYDIPVRAAKIAQMHARQFLLVSSVGANPRSSNFYLRTKGEAEKAILGTTLSSIHILRPSFLIGPRKEKRGGEAVAKFFSGLFNPFLIGGLRKYRGIPAEIVATAMICLALADKKGIYFYESHHIGPAAFQKPYTRTPLVPDL